MYAKDGTTKIKENYKYYIDEYKNCNEYIKEIVSIVESKKIKSFFSLNGLSWNENQDFALKAYDTDDVNYLIVDDAIVKYKNGVLKWKDIIIME